MRVPKIALLFIMIFSMAISLYALYLKNKISQLEELIIYGVFANDELTEDAFFRLSKINSSTINVQKESRLPIYVYLPDFNCISLEPKKGVLGSYEIFCYDKVTKKFLFHHSEFE